jgi:hypothetical protein
MLAATSRGTGFEIGPIGLIGHIGLGAQTPHKHGFFAVFFPQVHAAHAQEIAVVGQEFLQACPRDIGQFHFRFFGGSGNLAAFDDVLLAGSRGLHHLVAGTVAPIKEPVAETDRGVIGDLGFAEGEEVCVSAVGWDEALGHGRLKGRGDGTDGGNGTNGTNGTQGSQRNVSHGVEFTWGYPMLRALYGFFASLFPLLIFVR